MRKLMLAVLFVAATCVGVLAEEAAERHEFFDLYSMEVPPDWKIQTVVEEYSVIITSPEGDVMAYVLPPDPTTGATNQEYAEWFLNRFSKSIGADTWSVIKENPENTFNGYANFMMMIGMPESNARVYGIINVFDVDGFQVLQYAFTGKDKMETYIDPIANMMGTYQVDEEAMKKMEFTLKKKSEYNAKKMNTYE